MTVDPIGTVVGYDISTPFTTNGWIRGAIEVDPNFDAVADGAALDVRRSNGTLEIGTIRGPSILHHAVLKHG